MHFQHQFQQASSHYRYQERLLHQMHFMEKETSYAFSLNAIADAHLHYPNGISLHPLPGYVFLYTVSGHAILHCNNHSYTLNSNSMIWIPCSDSFHVEITQTNEDWHVFMIFASGDSFDNYYNDYIECGVATITTTHSPNIFQIIQEVYSYVISDTPESPLMLSKLLSDLVTALVLDRQIQSHYGEGPKQIINIIHYIQNHYREHLTLDSIANHFVLSKYSLSRDFSNHMNQSLIDYLIDYRVEKSKQLLTTTNHSVSEIASSIGFSTVNNFLQQFKKRVGMTPTAYRQQHQIYSSNHVLSTFDNVL